MQDREGLGVPGRGGAGFPVTQVSCGISAASAALSAVPLSSEEVRCHRSRWAKRQSPHSFTPLRALTKWSGREQCWHCRRPVRPRRARCRTPLRAIEVETVLRPLAELSQRGHITGNMSAVVLDESGSQDSGYRAAEPFCRWVRASQSPASRPYATNG